MNQINFISGLPRSGSTLLSGLLRQNPRFHAHISSPVAAMFGSLQTMLSGRSEYHPLITDAVRSSVLRGIFESYYVGIWDDRIVFDTNRSWTAKLPALLNLFPSAKMVCCVRPLAWILDSFERLVRENPLEPSKIYNFRPGGNVYTRSEHLSGAKGVVGSSYQNLRTAFYGPLSKSLLLVPYDVLTRAPEGAMAAIYKFLELDPFTHDFNNVLIEADEFDRQLGTPNLHTVQRSVTVNRRPISLPPDLVKRFANSQFWSDMSGTKATILSLGSSASRSDHPTQRGTSDEQLDYQLACSRD